jgi:hypothetical protein
MAMKLPDVQLVGRATVEGQRYTLFMVSDDWEPDLDGHDSDHARGGCTCPCWPPMYVIEEAAVDSTKRRGTIIND